MSHITTTAAGLAAVVAAGLIGAPASAASGAIGGSSTALATQAGGCKSISGSPKGAPRADIAVYYCWQGSGKAKRVFWTTHYYPRGTRIGLEVTGVRKGAIYTVKSKRPKVSYSVTRGRFNRTVDHVWFKACKVRGTKVYYACTVLR
ncbi:hypothetical protein ACFLIM_05060 [Nonomuraea sp. M3C6]|uniref:Ig-like domain-containing protein n=1 Tax=Nonomuraea marmarensis TaxID=3351344 RepID=A0ABW7A5D9_9ACTN